jgi:uncharacterized protein YuzE
MRRSSVGARMNILGISKEKSVIDVEHDPGEGVCYVRISLQPVHETAQLQSCTAIVNVDYDATGNVVGVEFVA